MGKTVTPKYVIEMDGCSIGTWKGRIPTLAQLEKHVMEYVVSTMPGLINEVIGYTNGIRVPRYARVRENRLGGAVKREWTAGRFQVIPAPADYTGVMRMEAFWTDQKAYLERTGQTGGIGPWEMRRAEYENRIDELKKARPA